MSADRRKFCDTLVDIYEGRLAIKEAAKRRLLRGSPSVLFAGEFFNYPRSVSTNYNLAINGRKNWTG